MANIETVHESKIQDDPTSNITDEFGEPYTLFPEEAEAVRVLYAQAKQNNIKVHSVFELAQLGRLF